MTDDRIVRVPRVTRTGPFSALSIWPPDEARRRHHGIPQPGAEGSSGFDGGGEGPAGEVWLGRLQIGRGDEEAVKGSMNPPIITKEITEAPA